MGASLGKIELAQNQALPIWGSRCKTSLMREAFEPPTSSTTTTLFPGQRETMSNQTSAVEQLKQQRKRVKNPSRSETSVAICLSRAT
jgi:hypothetical protein